MKIGVLALQGAFREHISTLRECGAEAVEVRLPREMEDIDALIIPGGESTTMSKLMVEYGFPETVRSFVKSGKPVMGTCAGLILLAERQQGAKQELINSIDIDVIRNAYGRQKESREADVDIPVLGEKPFHAIFIRAPQIESAGPSVEVLARYQGRIVLARQKNILVCAFHPELTSDTRVHRLFLEMVGNSQSIG